MSNFPSLHALDGEGDSAADAALCLRGLKMRSPCPRPDDGFHHQVGGPHLLQIMDLARCADRDGVLESDRAFEGRLPAAMSESGRLAGREMLEDLASARHANFARRISASGSVQWVTAFGLRCSAFHVPPVNALVSLRVLEMAGGGQGLRHGISAESVRGLLEQAPSVPAAARRIFEDWCGGANRLHCA